MAASFLALASSGDLAALKEHEVTGDLISYEDGDGKTALHAASVEGHLEVVEWLLSQGFVVDAKNRKGLTPLHYSVYRGHLGVARALVAAGGDAAARDASNRSMLHLACTAGVMEVITFLCEELYQSPYDAPASDGMNCAHFAALAGHTGVLEWLWGLPEEGADSGRALCSGRQDDGMQPLHFAVMKGHVDTVTWLVETGGVDTNAADNKGRTPLHLAVAASSTPLVTLLLHAGADPRRADKEGKNPAILSRGIVAAGGGGGVGSSAEEVKEVLTAALAPPTPPGPPSLLTANAAQELEDEGGGGSNHSLPPPGWGKEGDRVYLRWPQAVCGAGAPALEYALQWSSSRSGGMLSMGSSAWKEGVIFEAAATATATAAEYTTASGTPLTYACLGGLPIGGGGIFVRVRGRNVNGWGAWSGKSEEIVPSPAVTLPLTLATTGGAAAASAAAGGGGEEGGNSMFAGLAVVAKAPPFSPGATQAPAATAAPAAATAALAAAFPVEPQHPTLPLPAIEAATKGDLEALKSLHASGVILKGSDSGNSRNLLHHAAHGGGVTVPPTPFQCPCLSWLLGEEGGGLNSQHHLNARDGVGATPILLAVVAGSLPAVKYLASRGANINTPDTKGFSPLHYAAVKGHPAIFRWLLEAGGEVAAKTADGRSVRDVVESAEKVRDELRMLLGNGDCLPLAPPAPTVLEATPTSIALALPMPKWAPGSRLPYGYEVQVASRSGFSAALSITWATSIEVAPSGVNICAPSYCSSGAAPTAQGQGGLAGVTGPKDTIPTPLSFTPSVVVILGLAPDKKYAFQIRALSGKGVGLWSERTVDVVTPPGVGGERPFSGEITSLAAATGAAATALVATLKAPPSATLPGSSLAVLATLTALKHLKPPTQAIMLALKGEKFTPSSAASGAAATTTTTTTSSSSSISSPSPAGAAAVAVGVAGVPTSPTPSTPSKKSSSGSSGSGGGGEVERLVALAAAEASGGLKGLKESTWLAPLRTAFMEASSWGGLVKGVGEEDASAYASILSSAAHSGELDTFKWLIGEEGFAPPSNLTAMLSSSGSASSSSSSSNTVVLASALGGFGRSGGEVFSHLFKALGWKAMVWGGALHGGAWGVVTSGGKDSMVIETLKRGCPGGEGGLIEAAKEWSGVGGGGAGGRKGWSPLHYAVSASGSGGKQGLEAFLSLWSPTTLTCWAEDAEGTEVGMLPTHLAAAQNSTAALHALKELAPHTLWVKDSGGLAPIHYAAASNAGAAVSYLLWAARLAGVGCAHVQDALRRSPMDLAEEAGAGEALKVLGAWEDLR